MHSFLEPREEVDVSEIEVGWDQGKRSVRFNFSKVARYGAIIASMLALAGCVATERKHGYVPPEDLLAEIVVGVDTRDSVEETVGAPTASGVLRDSGFYYVESKFRNFGALEPRVVSRELVAISFDEAGVVQGIERFGLEKGRTVTLERRVTDNGTEDNGFLRQLLGNLGNFSPGQFLDQ